MRRVYLALCRASVALLVGCGGDSANGLTDAHSTNNGIEVSLAVDRHPNVMETVTLTCSYEVDYPYLPEGRDDYVVKGHFVLPVTHFTVVSGDSSWVDTVMVNTRSEHYVVVQAIKPGDWLVDALATSVIEESVSVISGGASVEVHVQ